MLKVLIVDDEQVVRIYLKTMIQWEKHQFEVVGVCKNGSEAIELAKTKSIDIVLTDLKMPKCNGLELIEALKTVSPQTKVLVLSNHGDYDLVRQALKLGAEDYFLKITLDEATLLKALEAIREKIMHDQQHEVELIRQAEENKENVKIARQSFLTTLIRGDLYYLEHELETYLKKYALIDTPLTLIKLQLLGSTQDVSKGYINGFIEEIFKGYTLDIIHLSYQEIYLVVYNVSDAFEEKVSVLLERIRRDLLGYMNLNADVSYKGMTTDITQLLSWVSDPVETTQPTPKKKTSPLISDDEAKRCRKEIRQVVEYIHTHFDEKITLQDLAIFVSLNEAYLSRLFKSETGKTVNHYLNEIRVYQASELLKNRDLMVKEVAQLVGIKDQLYFNRVFKKFYGLSPSEYKERVKKVHL